MKKKIYQILSVSSTRGSLSWYFDLFLISLISLNVVAIVLESVASIREEYGHLFASFEILSVIFFTIEYLLRVWTANVNPKYKTPVIGNLRYVFTPMALVDFLAILPFYLPFFGFDLRTLRILRLFRLLRLFKLARYAKALSLMSNVFRDKREELTIALMFTLFMLLITSSVMYFVENEAQPDNFSSIPQTMWWSIATLTTVGYGDVYPVTPLGKFLGGLIAVLGIGLFALPTGILASGFSEQLAKGKQHEPLVNCPKCGHEITKGEASESA
jgi:voltage-gated potassium channel